MLEFLKRLRGTWRQRRAPSVRGRRTVQLEVEELESRQLLSIAVGKEGFNANWQNPELWSIGTNHEVYAQRLDQFGRSASFYTTRPVTEGEVLQIAAGINNSYGDQNYTNPVLYAIGLDNQVYVVQLRADGTAEPAFMPPLLLGIHNGTKPPGKWTLLLPGKVKEIVTTTEGTTNRPATNIWAVGMDNQVYAVRLGPTGDIALTGYIPIDPFNHGTVATDVAQAIAAGNDNMQNIVGSNQFSMFNPFYTAPVIYVVGTNHRVYRAQLSLDGTQMVEPYALLAGDTSLPDLGQASDNAAGLVRGISVGQEAPSINTQAPFCQPTLLTPPFPAPQPPPGGTNSFLIPNVYALGDPILYAIRDIAGAAPTLPIGNPTSAAFNTGLGVVTSLRLTADGRTVWDDPTGTRTGNKATWAPLFVPMPAGTPAMAGYYQQQEPFPPYADPNSLVDYVIGAQENPRFCTPPAMPGMPPTLLSPDWPMLFVVSPRNSFNVLEAVLDPTGHNNAPPPPYPAAPFPVFPLDNFYNKSTALGMVLPPTTINSLTPTPTTQPTTQLPGLGGA